MLPFVLHFFLSLSILLWDALINNACRDLPPSRALAIAQGRLDPISMCAFNEFACDEAMSLQHTVKEAKLTRDNCGDQLSSQLMQGDVWLGTDEELFTLAAAGVPELPLSPLPTSACSLPLSAQLDNGFLAHLTSMSNSKAVVRPPLREQPPAGNTTIVTLSPGKKRVLPPPPNNNPFKRGKPGDTSSGLSRKAWFCFDTELEEKVFCREGNCSGKASCVPHQASRDAILLSQTKHEAHKSSVTADPVDNHANPSSISVKAGHCQDLVCAISTSAPLHMEDLEREKDIDISAEGAQVLIESEGAGVSQVSMQCEIKMPASLQADCFGIKPAQGLQALTSPVLQDLVVHRNPLHGYTLPMAHGMLPTLHHMNVGSNNSKTPTIIKQMQRESKAKKEIRSSSKQSGKVVTVASTRSLLKFFQRAPTL